MDNYNIEEGGRYVNRENSQYNATVREVSGSFIVYVTASGKLMAATRAEFIQKYNVPKRAFIPRNGQPYFYISGTMEVVETEYDEDDDDDTSSVANGNYFRTRTAAEVVLAQIVPFFRDANHG